MAGEQEGKQEGTQGQGSTESPEGSPNPEGGQQDPSGSTNQSGSPQGGAESGESRSPTLDFDDPMLKGKDPREIEETFKLLRQANQEQGQMLTRLQQQGGAGNADPDGGRQPKKEEDGYDEVDFFDDPDKKLDLFQKRMAGMIEQAIEPFKKNLETQVAGTVRDQLRSEYDDFAKFEPVINTLLQQMGVNPAQATAKQLEQLYFTAVGYANKKGIDVSGSRNQGGQNVNEENQQGQQNQGNQPPVNPPNRRPSGAPPAPKGNQEETRELTESERTLARKWGMSPEEYIEWQETPQDEVVKPGYSFEGGQ